MNKILIAIAYLCCVGTVAAQQEFVYPTAADYPRIEKSGKTCETFVPRGFSVVKKATGDLNADKQPDCFLVAKANDARFLNKNEGLGSEIFDTNPRVLLILLKDNDGYQLAAQSNTFIKTPDFPTMDEPFEDATIKNGVLQLEFQIFLSAGGWGAAKHFYKFRFQNNEFALIGADKTEYMRNTGDYEDRSYNFLTGKVKIAIGNNSEERPRKTFWRNFKLKQLKTLDTLKEPFAWEIERDSFI